MGELEGTFPAAPEYGRNRIRQVEVPGGANVGVARNDHVAIPGRVVLRL